MNCPICKHPESFVVRTDPEPDKNKRRRECSQCHHRFTTFESTEDKSRELENLKRALAPVTKMVT